MGSEELGEAIEWFLTALEGHKLASAVYAYDHGLGVSGNYYEVKGLPLNRVADAFKGAVAERYGELKYVSGDFRRKVYANDRVLLYIEADPIGVLRILASIQPSVVARVVRGKVP